MSAGRPFEEDVDGVVCDHCGGHLSAADTGTESRCACGSLLGRVTPQGLEVKCRRCKRTVLLTWPAERSQTTESAS